MPQAGQQAALVAAAQVSSTKQLQDTAAQRCANCVLLLCFCTLCQTHPKSSALPWAHHTLCLLHTPCRTSCQRSRCSATPST